MSCSHQRDRDNKNVRQTYKVVISQPIRQLVSTFNALLPFKTHKLTRPSRVSSVMSCTQVTSYECGCVCGGCVCGGCERAVAAATSCCEVLHSCVDVACVAVCCSVLQCVAVCCSVVQCGAVCCSMLQYVAVCCSVLLCDTVCCSMLQYVAVCCSVLQYVAVCCSSLCARALFELSHSSMSFGCGRERARKRARET